MGITPTNIWLDDEMVPKLGACGLSKFFAKDQTQIYNKEIQHVRLLVLDRPYQPANSVFLSQ